MAETNNTQQLIEQFKIKWRTERWKSLGYYDDDFLTMINPHWLSFEPPTEEAYYVLAVLYAIIMVVGVSGNILVMFMYLRYVSTSFRNFGMAQVPLSTQSYRLYIRHVDFWLKGLVSRKGYEMFMLHIMDFFVDNEGL